MNAIKMMAGRMGTLRAAALLLVGTCTLTLASEAHAQSGAALLIAPWQEGERIELDADLYLQSRGDVRGPGNASVRINTYEASGRFRFDADADHTPAVGFDLYHVDLNRRGGVAERLSDQSVAIGFGVGEFDGWEVGVTAGFGFAGDLPYNDHHAWYAKGNLIASRRLDADSVLQLGLNHDGNRSLLPDVPLPGIAYHHRVSDTFRYTAGIPYNAINWQPMPQLTLEATYTLLYTIDVTATYHLMESLDIYGGFYNRYTGFHLKGDDDNRRVFFRQRRLETGVRYSRSANWELIGAVGYAFGQELRRGWDVRDLSDPTEFSSEPYLRLGFEMSF